MLGTIVGWVSFLSTPSARRATHLGLQQHHDGRHFYPRPPRGGRPAGLGFQQLLRDISIHALREEGDQPLCGVGARPFDFYPRPPRGGRRGDCGKATTLK